MNHLQDLLDYSPRTSGEVFRNSKTKVFTDGTTNTVVSRANIFKDKYILTENKEKKEEQRQKQLKADREAFADKVDKVYNILERCGIMSYEFWELTAHENDDDFLLKLSEIGMSIHEYDYCNNYFKKKVPQEKSKSPSDPRPDSVKRAKDQIFDYVLNNDFDYFFTGTIDPENLDSKDPKELLKPVQKWLKNMVQRYNMQYLMIAERHKKGGIHFHGLFKADNLKLIDSGTKLYKGHKKPISNDRAEKLGLYEGRTVYNLKTWQFGFTTCVPLVGDRMNTAFYVTKYITKDCKKIFGKFFWHSRDLKKPLIVIDDMDFDSVQAAESNGFKYIFQRGDNSATV